MHRSTCSLLAVLALLAACGDGSAEETTPGPGTDTTGNEAATEGGDGQTDEALMVDPCAEGEGEPCSDEQGVDARSGELTDGGVEAADGGVPDGGETDAGEEPQMAWRDMVGAGRVVFDRVCGVCHPEGEEDIGPNIHNKRVPEERLRYIIRHGTGRMRPIPQRKLPDRYLDELMAYLTTMGTVTGVRRPE